MEKNDVFEIEITGMTDDGDGVGRAEGMAVFVPYTIIGETVRVHIIKVNKSYAIGKLLEVIRPSESRIKAECEYFYKCGGCQLWHMDYDAELKFKQKKVADCIRRIGGIDAEILPIISAEETYRYRNKVQMPVSDAGIGFYKKNSHNVIDMDDCLLQTSLSDKIVAIVRQWMKEWNVSPYNEESGAGTVRNIFTRVANRETVVVIVTSERKVQNIDKLTERLKKADGSIVGVVQNINQSKTNKVLGSENILLWGREYVIDNI